MSNAAAHNAVVIENYRLRSQLEDVWQGEEFERRVQAEVDRRAVRRRHAGAEERRRVRPLMEQLVNELSRIAAALESIDTQMRDA